VNHLPWWIRTCFAAKNGQTGRFWRFSEKLLDLLGDADEGLPLKKRLRDRLVRQQRAVAQGERGESLQKVAKQLGLD
jgi:hypothetical protein